LCNVLPFFDALDGLLNVSNFENNSIYKEYRLKLLSVGFALATIVWVLAIVRAMAKNGKIGAELRYTTTKFVLYVITVVLALVFFSISARLTDIIGMSMLDITVSETQFHEYTEKYYQFKKENDPHFTDEAERDAKIELAKSGERISGAVLVYSYMASAFEADADLFTSMFMSFFIGAFFVLTLGLLFLFGAIRDFLLIGLVVATPILLAFPIHPTFTTLNVFKAFLKICIHHLGMIFGFCITFMWIQNLSGEGIIEYFAFPVVLIAGTFFIAHMFQSAVNTGGSLMGMNYKMGLAILNDVKRRKNIMRSYSMKARKFSENKKNRKMKSSGKVKSYTDNPLNQQQIKKRAEKSKEVKKTAYTQEDREWAKENKRIQERKKAIRTNYTPKK